MKNHQKNHQKIIKKSSKIIKNYFLHKEMKILNFRLIHTLKLIYFLKPTENLRF